MKRRARVWFFVGFLLLLVLAAIPFVLAKRRAPVVAEADLGDGRIIQIEAVTFGTRHQVGNESQLTKRFGGWMPQQVRKLLEPRVPRSVIEEKEPALLVWVTAVSATFRTNVDCQGIRLDFIDDDGTVYTEHQSSWYGHEAFWRVGHIFRAFPRQGKTLNLKVTSWRGTNSLEFVLPNPGQTEAARWVGETLPQKRAQGEYEVVLRSLAATANKGEYWKASATYWTPEFEVWRNGTKEESGWDIEWTAEDAYGNRGKELGVKQPVLKFAVQIYPSGTNVNAAVLITNTLVANAATSTNVWWNLATMVTTNRVEILGLFPAGVHTFSEGEYLTNPPTKFAPVRGGAPSGWVGSSRQTPLRTISFHGHYSDVPVIYVRVADPKSKQRIAMRVRDVESGQYFITPPEDQGVQSKIAPFLLRIPTNVTSVQAELMLLPPLNAEFLVDTKEFREAVK